MMINAEYALINGVLPRLKDLSASWILRDSFVKPITLESEALVYIELRPDLDYDRIRGNAKPVRVVRGIFEGWSLPIYANDDEELYLSICIPNRYDEASNILVHVKCYLDTANTDKKFGLRLAHEHYTPVLDTVPNTSTNVDVQTSTGVAAQYQSFDVEFIITYDGLIVDDQLALRLYRIAADPVEDEIAGNIVVTHIGAIFRRDKLGVAV